MRVALAAAALAVAGVSAPAGAVMITFDPFVQSFLTEHDGFSEVCGPSVGGCVVTPTGGGGLLTQFSGEIPSLNGTFSFNVSGGSSFAVSLTGSVSFLNGILLSSEIDSTTDDHTYDFAKGLFYENYSHGHYTNVAVRLANGTILLPVPEPATWTMLLIGLGATGFVMRRRRAFFRLAPAV